MAALIKGRPWPALFYACGFSPQPVLACLAVIGLAAGTAASAAEDAPERSPPPDSGIVIAGAVTQPGIVRAPLPLAQALAEAGGLSAQAYALGAVLLRPASAAASTSQACLARHRSWLSAQLATIPDLDPNIVSYLIDQVGKGRLVRIPVALASVAQETGAADTVLLGVGDVLIIPARPSTVAVVGESLAGAQQWRYEPGLRVEDYLDQYLRPSTDQRALALYLPDGRLRELRLNFWNYEKQVVPPGSVIWMGARDRASRACVE